MFRRLHTPPKKVPHRRRECMTPRQIWLYDRSYERYCLTEDGKYFLSVMPIVMAQGEIGRVESVRFIETAKIEVV